MASGVRSKEKGNAMDGFSALVAVLAGLVTITGGIVAVWRYLRVRQRRESLQVSAPRLTDLNAGGHHHEALILSEQAIRSDPQDALAYVNKGWALNALGKHQKALQACEQAILLSLNAPIIRAAACRHKAWALNGLGNHYQALQACNDAIRLQPGVAANAYTYVTKSGALNGLGRPQEALQVCEEALRLYPEDDNLKAAIAKQKDAALKALRRH